MRKILGPEITLQGNLEPRILQAAPDVVERRVQEFLESMANDSAYIFNLGHGVFPDTPPASVKKLVQVVQDFG